MWRQRVRNIHTILAILLALATGMALAAPLGWPFELASHFPLHMAIVSVVVGVWCARQKAGEAALLCCVVLAINLSIVAPTFLEPRAQAGEGQWRVLTANVLYKSDDYEKMLFLVAKEVPDVVVIVEETPAWREGLSALSAEYPYQEHSGATARVRGASGVGVYSKTPLIVVPMENVPYRDERPALAVKTSREGEEVVLVAVHPWTPDRPGRYAKRNVQLGALADFTTNQGVPAIMAGDLNITPYSPDFRALLASYNLTDARSGRGWAPSWPTQLGVFGIPIDHALHTADIEVFDFRMAPSVGSDHYPTILDFSVEAKGR